MILPKYMLEDFGYFTLTVKDRPYQVIDIVTVHYKPWWKWSRKFKFQRTTCYKNPDPDVCTYTMQPGCVELMQQLRDLQEE